jgi:hypothetical protein
MTALLAKSDGCDTDITVAERICLVLSFLISLDGTCAAAENYSSGKAES